MQNPQKRDPPSSGLSHLRKNTVSGFAAQTWLLSRSEGGISTSKGSIVRVSHFHFLFRSTRESPRTVKEHGYSECDGYALGGMQIEAVKQIHFSVLAK